MYVLAEGSAGFRVERDPDQPTRSREDFPSSTFFLFFFGVLTGLYAPSRFRQHGGGLDR